jgi:hypothetical protein
MKKLLVSILCVFLVGVISPAYAVHKTTHHKTRHHHKVAHKSHNHRRSVKGVSQPISIDQIDGYANYSPDLKMFIAKASKLSQMNLAYKFGSADPKNKGLDCSGTIYYLLNKSDYSDVPRDADGLFNWVKDDGKLYHVSSRDFESSDFSKLKPGDLLFWSGTYHSRNPISHVMLYLGKNKEGKPLMFGSSSGRSYNGKKLWGVSVFDFKLPSGRGKQKFVGYGCIPELTCA